ncbi:MAG: hypothetical protein AAF685_12945 [Cyanobacteria bacterium P01_C01_bin.89]
MFFDELTPLVREVMGQPVAFIGGLASGLFRMDPTQDPVKSWLEKQGANPFAAAEASTDTDSSDSGPQTIDIE